MQKTTMIGMLLLIACVTANASGVDNQKLFAEYVSIQSQIKQLRSQLDAVNGDLRFRIGRVQADIKMLGKPAFDEKMIKHYENNAKLHNGMANERKKFLEFAKIADAAKRKQLHDKYDAERAELLDKERAADKPFDKRIKELKKKFKKEQKLFDAAMGKYCLLPNDKYPSIVSKECPTQFYNAMVTPRWFDGDRRQVFFAFILPAKNPTVKPDAEKLYDKYPIISSWPHMIEIWAGNFRVSFHALYKEWQGKEKIAEVFKDFVDLEGLASIDPDEADTKLNSLVKSSIGCTENHYNPIRDERQKTISPLTDRRVLVKNLMQRLKKPPADARQVRQDKEALKSFQKDTKLFKRYLEIGTITDMEKREELKQKLEAEKKSLYEKNKTLVLPYDVQIKKLKKSLKQYDQQIDFETAVSVYFLDGGGRYDGIVNKEVTGSRYPSGSCKWKDSDGQKLCTASFRVEQNPPVPEGEPMLDGKYYIQKGGGKQSRMTIWVGKFEVGFSVYDKKWLEKELIDEIVKKFVDIDGLAAL